MSKKIKSPLTVAKHLLCVSNGDGTFRAIAARKTFRGICGLEAKTPEAIIVTQYYVSDESQSDFGEVYWFDCNGGAVTISNPCDF